MATILQILNADRSVSLFSHGLKKAGLERQLSGGGPFTIFGPVNIAVNRLLSLSFSQLLEPVNHKQLIEFLSGYILLGSARMQDFRNKQQLQALDGSAVRIFIRDNETFINGARIISYDCQGSNGVIHIMDRTYPPLEPGNG